MWFPLDILHKIPICHHVIFVIAVFTAVICTNGIDNFPRCDVLGTLVGECLCIGIESLPRILVLMVLANGVDIGITTEPTIQLYRRLSI